MIARKSTLIISANILNGVLAYIAIFYISRFNYTEEFGIIKFAIAFVTLFNIIGSLGFDSANIKRISEGKDLGRCIGTFIVIKISLIFIMSLVTIAAVYSWKHLLGRGFETSTHETVIYIILVYLVLNTINGIFRSIFSAKKEIVKIEIPLLIETLVRVVATVYVVFSGLGVIELAYTYIISDIALLSTSLFLFRGYPIKKPSYEYFRSYKKFARPMVLVGACAVIMTNIDKVLIQLFWNSYEVGFYSYAYSLCMYITMFTTAVGILLFPTFSSLHANKDLEGAKKLILKTQRYLSMVVFPLVFGMVALAQPAVFILLSNKEQTVPILRILPFFVLLAAIERPYQSHFLGIDRPKIARNRVLIMVIINLILNIVLIPEDINSLGIKLAGLGAKGAAIATVFSYAAGLIYSTAVTKRKIKLKISMKSIFIHFIAATIMAGVLYWIAEFIKITRFYHLLGVSIFGLGIYILVIFLLKEFTKKDLMFFLDQLNIKKMFIYMKEEIKRNNK